MNSKQNIPAISIIIPVYNNEEFLDKTFCSLLNQTMQDFELIVINDGSTDGSLEKIKKYCSKFKNAKYFDKPNQGVSSARNVGLKHAIGEYISFIDGDDFVEPCFLEKMYSEAKKTNSDVVCCNHSFFISKLKKHKANFPYLKPGIYKKEDMINCVILDFSMHYYVWNKLWKRSLFLDNNIEFPNMCFEDIATTPRLFYCANNISVLPDSLYNYTKHEGSLVSSINIDKFNDYIRAIGVIRNFLQKNNDYDPYKTSLKMYGCRVILTNLKLLFKIHSEHKNFKTIVPNIKRSTKAVIYYVGNDFEYIDDFDSLTDTIEPPVNK